MWSAEKFSCRSIKKGNMSKEKTLIEKVGTRYLKQMPWSSQQTIPDHRLYLSVPQTGALITSADNSWPLSASTFPYSCKNSSAEHIHALSTWLITTNTLTHIDKHTHTHTHTHIDKHTHTHSYRQTHTHIPQPNIFSLYQHGSPSQTYTVTHTRTHTHTHAHTHTRTQTHAHRHTHTDTRTLTHAHTHTDALTLTHTGICIRKREYVRLRNC